MKASGIFNGNWQGGIYREYLRDVEASAGNETELTPRQEIARLDELILIEQGKVAKFASRPRVVAFAREYIERYEKERLEWQTAIEVEAMFEQAKELFNRLVSGDYPAELQTARRATFIGQIRNGGAS